MTGKVIITPRDFQEMCDQAVLTLGLQGWPADASPHDIAGAVISDIHARVCRRLGEDNGGRCGPAPPNERRMEEMVGMVSQHWSGPILVERTVNATIRIVLEHWRKRHNLEAPYPEMRAGTGLTAQRD